MWGVELRSEEVLSRFWTFALRARGSACVHDLLSNATNMTLIFQSHTLLPRVGTGHRATFTLWVLLRFGALPLIVKSHMGECHLLFNVKLILLVRQVCLALT